MGGPRTSRRSGVDPRQSLNGDLVALNLEGRLARCGGVPVADAGDTIVVYASPFWARRALKSRWELCAHAPRKRKHLPVFLHDAMRGRAIPPAGLTVGGLIAETLFARHTAAQRPTVGRDGRRCPDLGWKGDRRGRRDQEQVVGRKTKKKWVQRRRTTASRTRKLPVAGNGRCRVRNEERQSRGPLGQLRDQRRELSIMSEMAAPLKRR